MVPLSKLIDTLGKAQGGRIVVAGLLTSEGCPWCVALKKEQLLPRSRAQMSPGFLWSRWMLMMQARPGFRTEKNELPGNGAIFTA